MYRLTKQFKTVHPIEYAYDIAAKDKYMFEKILDNVRLFKITIEELKSISPLFPKIHFVQTEECLWVTTMVVFSHNNIVYKRHCADSIKNNGTITALELNFLLGRVYYNAELIIEKGVPIPQFDEAIN